MKNQIAENIRRRRNQYRLVGIAVLAVLITIAAASVSGCSKAERFVLEADHAQIGAGARIEMQGRVGRFKMAPIPGWPKGIDETVTLNPESDIPLSHLWTITIKPNTNIVFVRSAAGWVCQTCAYLKLPLMWHVAAP